MSNPQSFSPKNPQKICSYLANHQQLSKELDKPQKQWAVSQMYQCSLVTYSLSKQCLLMRNMNTGYYWPVQPVHFKYNTGQLGLMLQRTLTLFTRSVGIQVPLLQTLRNLKICQGNQISAFLLIQTIWKWYLLSDCHDLTSDNWHCLSQTIWHFYRITPYFKLYFFSYYQQYYFKS